MCLLSTHNYFNLNVYKTKIFEDFDKKNSMGAEENSQQVEEPRHGVAIIYIYIYIYNNDVMEHFVNTLLYYSVATLFLVLFSFFSSG